MRYRLTVRELTTERLPILPRWATTDRPVSKEVQRIIDRIEVTMIRRAQEG